MSEEGQVVGVHPEGEERIEGEGVSESGCNVDTFAGKVHIKWRWKRRSHRIPFTAISNFYDARVLGGRTQVVRQALRLLEIQERDRDEMFLQLKEMLRAGAEEADRGELLDGDVVFDEQRQMIAERRRAKATDR